LKKDSDGQFLMPWRADLEAREHIVLYDSRTNELPLNENGILFCFDKKKQKISNLTR